MEGTQVIANNGQYDWAKELKKFDDTKAGVKGLVDAGITKLPKFFVHPPETVASITAPPNKSAQLDIPTIDFEGLKARRNEVVEEIRAAAKAWGFFRIVNHGIPLDVMDAMLEATKRFHEQPNEEKVGYYSVDSSRTVSFKTGRPRSEHESAYWRDILFCTFHEDQLDPDLIPLVCRKEMQEYVKHAIHLREVMAELLSEALGLSSDHLSQMECMKSDTLACSYYPVCPEPEKTLGTPKHSDAVFLTLLMQDDIGGLQVLHDNQWVDVPPARGALIVNIGDAMQIISNDRFISVEHKVLAQRVGPRVSVACFFTPSSKAAAKPFGPIKELLSDESPAIYKEVGYWEYLEAYHKKRQDVSSALAHFKIC